MFLAPESQVKATRELGGCTLRLPVLQHFRGRSIRLWVFLVARFFLFSYFRHDKTQKRANLRLTPLPPSWCLLKRPGDGGCRYSDAFFPPWVAEIVSAQKMWRWARKKITGGLTPHCSCVFDSSDTFPLIQVLNYSFTACGWFETAVIAGEDETRWLELTSIVTGTTCFSGTQCSEKTFLFVGDFPLDVTSVLSQQWYMGKSHEVLGWSIVIRATRETIGAFMFR